MKNNKIIIKNEDVKSIFNNKNQNLNNAASKTDITNDRVEKNLKVLKLLQETDTSISDLEKRSIL